MCAVTIDRIAGTKDALDVCRVVEALYLAGKRAVVFIGDRRRAAILDDYLWTFSQPAFVPHCPWDGATPVEDRVVVVSGGLANPNGADTLVVAEGPGDLAAAAPFAEVHDVVAQLAEDAGKPSVWAAAGFAIAAARGPARPQ